MNPAVDMYLMEGCGRCPLGGTSNCKVHFWTKELRMLRKIVLHCGLTEEVKWGVPCYTFQHKNVLLLSAFKEYCAISFFKGSLLADPHQLLLKPGERSQATRLLKFTDTEKIGAQESHIKAYIFEAVEVEKAGLKVSFHPNPEPIPEELARKFEEDPILKSAFDALTPGRQRGYLIHFSQPKQSNTRRSRIEKCVAKILNGEGMHDKYSRRKK